MNKFSRKFTVLLRLQELVKIHLCTQKKKKIFYRFLKWRTSIFADTVLGKKIK